MIDPKWAKPLGIAMGLPGLIIAIAYISMKLVELGYIPRWGGMVLFLLVIGNSLFMMVYLSKKRKEDK